MGGADEAVGSVRGTRRAEGCTTRANSADSVCGITTCTHSPTRGRSSNKPTTAVPICPGSTNGSSRGSNDGRPLSARGWAPRDHSSAWHAYPPAALDHQRTPFPNSERRAPTRQTPPAELAPKASNATPSSRTEAHGALASASAHTTPASPDSPPPYGSAVAPGVARRVRFRP